MRQIFQVKWRLRVLQELVNGPVRLSELKRRVPDFSKKMLIETLHGLEKLAWVEGEVFSDRVKRVEYQLDSPCAEELRRTSNEIAQQ